MVQVDILQVGKRFNLWEWVFFFFLSILFFFGVELSLSASVHCSWFAFSFFLLLSAHEDLEICCYLVI